MRKHVAAAIEATGLLSFAAGALTVSPFFGLASLGLGLVLFGLAMERG